MWNLNRYSGRAARDGTTLLIEPCGIEMPRDAAAVQVALEAFNRTM